MRSIVTAWPVSCPARSSSASRSLSRGSLALSTFPSARARQPRRWVSSMPEYNVRPRKKTTRRVGVVRALEARFGAEVHQGSLTATVLSPDPLGCQQEYSKHGPWTVWFRQQVQNYSLIVSKRTPRRRFLVLRSANDR